MNGKSEWPYGVGTHYPSIRSWCIHCQESCYDPETSGFGYDALCHCCREPLYVLRIAELEAFTKAVCAEYEEYPDDPSQPFAGYDQVVEWIKQSRRDERGYAELVTCPMCDAGYPPHTCMTYLDMVKAVRKDRVRIAELEAELAKFKPCDGECLPYHDCGCWSDHHKEQVYHKENNHE